MRRTREDGQRLEAAPPDRENERILILEDLLVPPVLFHAHLHKAHLLLVRQQGAENQWVAQVEILDEFARHAGELDANVGARAAALVVWGKRIDNNSGRG